MSTDIIGECVQCKSQLSQYLKIRECENLHKVCGKCLMCILDESEDGKVICPECSTSLRKLPKLQNEPVYVFVDNSNIWTEAKKKVGRELQLKCSEDPRVRIHAGKLADVVSKGRLLARGKVYGSEPPPIDTVWKKIKACHKFEVEVFKRSTFTGKEKQVDQQLVADITETVCDHSISKGTIAMVCGDADVLPAIRKAIEKGWKCEVWIWEQCCAQAIKETEEQNRTLMKVVYLDDYLKEITFTNFSFDRTLFDKRKELISAVIVQANEISELTLANGWETELSSYLQWPFRHFFVGQEFRDLVFVFQNLDSDANFDFEKILKKLRDRFGEKAMPYIEYSNSAAKATETTQTDTALLNRFNMLQGVPEDRVSTATDSGEETTAAQSGEESFDNDNFQVVTYKRNTKGKTGNPQKYSDSCKDGAYCKNNVRCFNHHTKDEKRFFRSGGKKCFFCEMRYECTKRDKCRFAHDESDSFCRFCSKWGHLEGKAKKEKCFQKNERKGADP